jgi:hypothetical protein
MAYVFYLGICLFLVIIQTTVFPLFPVLSNFFDLMLPVIIYIGFFRSTRESIPVLILFGLVMDGLSGAPFGLFFSSYIWLYAVVLLLKQIFLVKKMLLLSFVAALGVLIQNGILIVVENLFFPKLNFLVNIVSILWIELLFAIIAGPVMIIAMLTFHQKWNLRLRRTFSRADEDYS